MTMPIEWLSVFCTYMISTLGSNSPTSPPYTAHDPRKACLRDLLPFLLQRIRRLLLILWKCWKMLKCVSLLKNVPIIFNWIKVCRKTWPVHTLNCFAFEGLVYYSGSMKWALSSMKIKTSPTAPAMGLTIE